MSEDQASPVKTTRNPNFPLRTSSNPAHVQVARKPVVERKPYFGQENIAPRTNGGSESTQGRSIDSTPPASLKISPAGSSGHSTPERTSESGSLRNSRISLPPTQTLPVRQRHIRDPSDSIPQPHTAEVANTALHYPPPPDTTANDRQRFAYQNSYPTAFEVYPDNEDQPIYVGDGGVGAGRRSISQNAAESLAPPPNLGMAHPNRSLPELRVVVPGLSRPHSTLTAGSGSDVGVRDHNRHLSVGGVPSPHGSPLQYARNLSASRYSPDNRPQSYVELLQLPYAQQVAPAPSMDNSFLRSAVGGNASLLDTRKTLEMYRANVKKTQEPAIQYEFALFMVQASMEAPVTDRQEMLREAKSILQRLADRSYPFAQYYLADGYASGVFNKGKEDYDRAFPLFVAASKHGHAEAGYRAALCYEFGWGCRRDYAKAFQFYRASASKNHPGAATRLGMACIQGTMGLQGKQRQGVSWLKRAADSADAQYNAAPYELACLHEEGFGDVVFRDEAYAAQLYTQSADLGHPEANLVMGKAYEHGTLMCPKDAALSIHFYTGAAQAGLPEAMMALCAWYLFGAEPILEKNENEAYEWANQAAALGYAKAEYAVGYFKEVGIGTRQDSLDANVWYVRAAQQGEERATARLAIIRNAASGGGDAKPSPVDGKGKRGLLSKLGL